VKKFSGFWPTDPWFLSRYFLIPMIPKWSFLQVIEQLKSFNLSQEVALRAIELENYGQITKKLREKFEFYGQNRYFF